MLSAGSRKVVLFSPPYAGKVLGPPLGLLSLAASLRENGYEPSIIDGALDRDYLPRIAREIEDCLCFGISLLTGPMILDAIEAARLVRNRRPGLPIIFGGWHPSLLPAQTLREDFVDIVVRHQGEKTLVEILQRLETGQPLDMVQAAGSSGPDAYTKIPTGPLRPSRPCRLPLTTSSISMPTNAPAAGGNCLTRPASAALTHATTALIWSSTTGASTRTM